MNSYHSSNSKKTIHQPLQLPHLSSLFKSILEILTHYNTSKVVRFESKWIATLSLMVKLTLAIICLYLMFQRDSYQIYDRSPISAVTIEVNISPKCLRDPLKIRNFSNYNCTQSLYDVNDFILPATENSAVSITTRMTETEHVLRYCDNNRSKRNKTNNKYSSMYAAAIHNCSVIARCILPPFYRNNFDYDTNIRKAELCWFKLPEIHEKINYQVLDYILFVKNFIEFPLLGFVRNNHALKILNKTYIDQCEYHNVTDTLCPKFRILKILELIEDDPQKYQSMFDYGSLIEIKIIWECNLDHHLNSCKPNYKFRRLDIEPYENNPFNPGSTFLTSKHFFQANDRQLHRIHTNIYNLHIIVSVTGEVGKKDLFQITTSIGSFIGIFGTGTIVCDLIATFFTNFKRVKYDS